MDLHVLCVGHSIGLQIPGTGVVHHFFSELGDQCPIKSFHLTVCSRVVSGFEKVFHIPYPANTLKEA